jgi:hypothetical protein
MTTDRTIFNIPEENFAKFEAQLAKLSRKSEKLIGSPINPFLFGYDYVDTPKGGKTKVFQVLLTAEVPKINGWTFVATLDHSQETGTIIRSVPNTGVSIPSSYFNCKPSCDHCKVMRYRRDTYLLRSDEGEFKQVGSNCLEDFFGHDPYAIAKSAELLVDADVLARSSEEFSGNGDRRYYDMESVLKFAAIAVRHYGFISRASAREDDRLLATADVVMLCFTSRDPEFKHDQIECVDEEVATLALEWAQNLDPRDNEYLHNIKTLANSTVIESRQVGLAASIVGSYLRNTKRLEKRSTDLGDMKAILSLFDTAKTKLKRPALILGVNDDVEIRLSVASETSRFPGSINVTDTDPNFETRKWFGRITLDGKFETSSRVEVPKGCEETLLAFAADPVGVAAEYGRKTGYCCMCNRKLKDKRSTELGYGPVCADNYGLQYKGKAA